MCGGRQLQNVMLIAVLNSLMFLAYNETDIKSNINLYCNYRHAVNYPELLILSDLYIEPYINIGSMLPCYWDWNWIGQA